MWVGARGEPARAQKESQVAKAAERDARSTGSAGSRDPAAPLPLPQSSNKLPWMLRFLDSFLSLSHISFAPSWQSVRAATVQLWKSSQYLARNRTNRRSRFTLGARGPPGSAFVSLGPRGLANLCGRPLPTSSPPPCRGGPAWSAFSGPRPTLEAAVRGGLPPPGSDFSLLVAGGDSAPRWHLGLRKQITRPPQGKLGKLC